MFPILPDCSASKVAGREWREKTGRVGKRAEAIASRCITAGVVYWAMQLSRIVTTYPDTLPANIQASCFDRWLFVSIPWYVRSNYSNSLAHCNVMCLHYVCLKVKSCQILMSTYLQPYFRPTFCIGSMNVELNCYIRMQATATGVALQATCPSHHLHLTLKFLLTAASY